jgi:hypothetical protein
MSSKQLCLLLALLGAASSAPFQALVSGLATAGEGSQGSDLLCRSFPHNVNEATVVETSDRSSVVGKWVAEERAKGWSVQSVDLEIAQKENGFPQGYVQVCMSGSR